MEIIPFQLSGSTHGGFSKCTGLLRRDGDRLVLEYEYRDGIFGASLGKPKSIAFELADLAGVEWKKTLLGGRLCLRLNSLMVAKGLPLEDGSLNLSVKRASRGAASDLALHFSLRLSETALRRSRDSLADPERS